MRVAVIGAGIVGVQVATHLARCGADVTLIDRGEPGGGTTAGSFAWIDASHPGIAPYLELRMLGVQAWQRQNRELGEPRWLSLPGTLTWVRDADAAASLEVHADCVERLGGTVERLSVQGALRREPDLVLPPDVQAVFRFPGEGWVQAAPAISTLLERGAAAGLRLRRGAEVRALDLDASERVVGLTLATGERVRSDAVVSCVGRWTGAWLAAAGVPVPMLEPDEAGVAGLVTRTTRTRCRIGSVILADGLLIRPEADGRLLLHSDACDTELTLQTPESGAAEKLIALLASRVRGTERVYAEGARMCLRAIPADRLPVVGWALDGLYVVATHSGVTLAPALGELVATELLEGEDRVELTQFRPERFQSAVR